MPSKGKPTVTQQQKKFAGNGMVHPDAYQDSNIRNRYVDSARILELKGDWQTSLAIRVFGPELMGSLAFALDGLSAFRNSFRKISQPTRRKAKGVHSVVSHSEVRRIVTTYQNFIALDGEPVQLVPFYFISEATNEFVYDPLVDIGYIEYYGKNLPQRTEEYQADSTQKQRFEGQTEGTCERLSKIAGNWLETEYSFVDTALDYTPSEYYGESTNKFCTKTVTRTTVVQRGATSVPAEWIYSDPDNYVLRSQCEDIAAYYAPDFIPRSLANRRQFEGFYQIGELQDLPKLIKGVADLRRFLANLLKSPSSDKLSLLDKRISDAYLTYLFGYKSLKDAVKDLLKTPERVANQMNYILKRIGKVSRGSYKKSFVGLPPEEHVDPVPLSYSPYGVTILQVNDVFTYEYDVRCVVNQTINFPSVMVPKFSDSNYRDFFGLNPKIQDIYNLIPWTWLADWGTGVSSYLNMIERLNDDRLLVNYGFMVVELRPKFVSSQIGQVSDTTTITNWDGSTEDPILSNKKTINFFNEYSYEYYQRMDISRLNGENKVASELLNLADDQLKIVGALLTKFT